MRSYVLQTHKAYEWFSLTAGYSCKGTSTMLNRSVNGALCGIEVKSIYIVKIFLDVSRISRPSNSSSKSAQICSSFKLNTLEVLFVS